MMDAQSLSGMEEMLHHSDPYPQEQRLPRVLNLMFGVLNRVRCYWSIAVVLVIFC